MATWAVTDSHFVRDVIPFSPEGFKQQERLAEESKNVFNVLAKLKEFRDEEKLCDIVVQVNKTKFPAHKAVFAAWSPKIANMILSQSNMMTDMTLILNYDNVDVFSEYLDYCYSGFIIPTELTIHSLLDIGRNFIVTPLIKLCEDYLKSSFSPANLVSRFITSVKYGLSSLEDMVISFVETNLPTVVEQNELLNLRPQDLEVFLSSGKMAQIKQEVKLSLIINWVGYSLLDRNKFLMYLLGQISWDHTVGDLLIQISCTENIFTSNEFCLFQLLQCVVNSNEHHLGPFMTTYPRLYSMYSHMIDELTLPKAFSTTSSRIEDIIDIPVSVVVCDKEPVAKMKDAEVNTDVDSTYFQEMQTVHDVEITTANLEKENLELIENADTQMSENHASVRTDESVEEVSIEPEKEDTATEADNDRVKSIPKHRRKGRPRKISAREGRRGRGKSKKSNNDRESGKPVVVDSTVVQEDQANADEIQIIIENNCTNGERLNSINTFEAENLQSDVSISNRSPDHEEAGDSDKIEEKPKIKLSLKLKHLRSTKSSSKARRKAGIKKTKKLSENKPIPEKMFRCSEENCRYTARTEFKLQRHVEIVHNTDVKLDCRHCDYSTNQMRELCFHMKSHYTKLPYNCDEPECSQQFLRMSLLVRHQMTHMNQKPYKCDLCSKSFGTINQLRCHKRLHEGRQFECDICYKRFTTKGVMQQHRAIHFDNKPYLCDTCGFTTKHLSHLVSHRKIHTGDVLRCNFPNCSYSTPKQGHMTQHINTHLNIRNHICQVCGKSFVVRGKLLRHERIHLKDKLYKCKQCDYQTSRTDRMKLHIESHGIKFKKKTFNRPVDDSDKGEIDFHELYEKVQSGGDSGQLHGLTEQSLVSLADMKPMDAISLAASASMIVDSYTTPRLMIDPISGEAVTNMEDTLTFQQSFERIHPASFDQL